MLVNGFVRGAQRTDRQVVPHHGVRVLLYENPNLGSGQLVFLHLLLQILTSSLHYLLSWTARQSLTLSQQRINSGWKSADPS